jgi:hypothetical protein
MELLTYNDYAPYLIAMPNKNFEIITLLVDIYHDYEDEYNTFIY